jgi:hypothetical protein
MIFRIRYETLGGHTHCALFSARQPNTTFAKCGEFCVRNEEFEDLRIVMPGVQFLEKDAPKC